MIDRSYGALILLLIIVSTKGRSYGAENYLRKSAPRELSGAELLQKIVCDDQ
ncbi:MAG: hypothetical protein ACR2GN_10810 [Bacteroidia bacterium]